jgi:hypothetical protein
MGWDYRSESIEYRGYLFQLVRRPDEWVVYVALSPGVQTTFSAPERAVAVQRARKRVDELLRASEPPTAPGQRVLAGNARKASPRLFVKAKEAELLGQSLVGLVITSETGDALGEIKDIVFADGRWIGLLLLIEGTPGRRIVLRSSALRMRFDDAEKKWKVSTHLTRAQVEAAPAFDDRGR